MNVQILIPARYASTRYPGKPLVELKGANGAAKPLIQRSVEAARRVAGVSGVFVTTDDERIADACAPRAARKRGPSGNAKSEMRSSASTAARPLWLSRG